MTGSSRRQFLNASLLGTAALATGCESDVGEEPRATRPNFLVRLPDHLRFDWTSFNPDIPVRTPNLERIAAKAKPEVDRLGDSLGALV